MPVTWKRADPNKEWRSILDEIEEAGFRWIELGHPGLFPKETDVVLKEIKRRELGIAGATRFLDLTNVSDSKSLQSIVELCSLLRESSASYLTVVEIPRNSSTGPRSQSVSIVSDRWGKLTQTLRQVIAIAGNDNGLRVTFHPHVDTTVFWAREIDRLMSEFRRGSLELCIDTAHSMLAHIDPIDLYKRYKSSVAVFHFRDVASSKVPEFESVSNRRFPFVDLVDVLKEERFEGWVTLDGESSPPARASTSDFLDRFAIRLSWLPK